MFLDITLWENGRKGVSIALSEDTTTSARNWGLSKKKEKCSMLKDNTLTKISLLLATLSCLIFFFNL